MAKKSILDQIESGERVRWIPVALEQPAESGGFGASSSLEVLGGLSKEQYLTPDFLTNRNRKS